jgi:hypothetical protein
MVTGSIADICCSFHHYRKAGPSVMGSVGASWGSVEPHGGSVGMRKPKTAFTTSFSMLKRC